MQLNQLPPSRHQRSLFAGRAVLLISAATIAGVVVGSAGVPLHLLPAVPQALAAVGAATEGPSFADLVVVVQPAVVSIRVELAPQNRQGARPRSLSPFGQSGRVVTSEGSGFFVSTDGYVVTANHVVDGATSVQVTSNDGTVYDARVIGADAGSDIAVLKVDANAPLPYLKFADNAPRVGDWVVAIGNPFGLGNTVTAGVVSALARDIGSNTFNDFMQIDAAINEGNSGGPTFDVHGNVVGVNAAIFTPSGGSVGIGFDIPADTAKAVTAALEQSGHVTRGWMGVQIGDPSAATANRPGPKPVLGAVIAQVEPGGPAARAGIQPGMVITAVDGKPIKDGRALSQAIAAAVPGTRIKLDILRAGVSQSIDVTVAERPPA